MVGAGDLQRSTAFYDALLAPLSLEKVELDAVYTAFAPKTAPSDFEFMSPHCLIRTPRQPETAAWWLSRLTNAVLLICSTR